MKCPNPECGSTPTFTQDTEIADKFAAVTAVDFCAVCAYAWTDRDRSEIDRLEARIAELEGKIEDAEECLAEIRDENKATDSVWLESDTNDTYGRWLARRYLAIPRPAWKEEEK